MIRSFSPEEKQKLQRQYQEKGILVIPDFFAVDIAEELHTFLSKKMEPSWWRLSTSHTDGSRETIPFAVENYSLMQRAWDRISPCMQSPGMFSYRFFRTTDHVPQCYCILCNFRELLSSPEVLDLLIQLTSFPLARINNSFASKYNEGCYLSAHTDKGNGELAFVYNVSKDWHPMMGGCLHMLDPYTLLDVNTVITPRFNSLTLFRVPKEGIPHYVSPVSPNVTADRLAFSGWFGK